MWHLCASGGVYVPCIYSHGRWDETYHRRLRFLVLYLCDVFRVLINSLVCWYFSAIKNPHNLLHEAVKTQQRDADWEGARLGWVKQRTQHSMYATRQISSKPRSGKGKQTYSGVSMRHSCQKTWKSAVENGPKAKQSQRSSFSFKKTANHRTSQCTLMAQSPKTSQDGASLSSKVWSPPMKTVQPIWSGPPIWQWRKKQSAHSDSGSQTTHTIILTDSMSLLQESKK